jgi:hypothetical protein
MYLIFEKLLLQISSNYKEFQQIVNDSISFLEKFDFFTDIYLLIYFNQF